MTDTDGHESQYDGPPAGSGKKATERRAIAVGQVFAAILFVLMVIFIVENTDDVKIRIIAGPKVTAPIFVALLIAAIAGALISELLRLRRRRRATRR